MCVCENKTQNNYKFILFINVISLLFFRWLGGSLLCLEYFNDNLLFLDEEGTYDLLLDALVTHDTAVRTTYGLLTTAQPRPLLWPSRLDTTQLILTLSTSRYLLTFLKVLVYEFTTGSTDTRTNKNSQ